MRKIFILLFIIGGLVGCNQEKIFPDYDFTAVYFPVQYPVRTLSLGNDRVDNSLDKELKFHIGISIGGMYENKKSWTVDFVINEALADSLVTSNGDTILPLPTEYYTMDPPSQVIIPPTSFNGLIEVQLTDAFLDDTLAFGHHYVIPLQIMATSADSILRGVPVIPDADKRVAADWDPNAPPKDFTLFMIKFVNPWHGKWLHRGTDYTLDVAENIIDTTIYHTYYLVDNKIWELATHGRNSVRTNGIATNIGADYSMDLLVDAASGNITVDSVPGSVYQVYGVGDNKWIKEGDEWGGKKRETIYLNYKYNDGSNDHLVYDTLVFRDRGIAYEEFLPIVVGN